VSRAYTQHEGTLKNKSIYGKRQALIKFNESLDQQFPNWPIEVTMTAIKEAITQMNPVPSAAQFWKLFNSRYGEVFQARSSERNRLNTFMASLR
jgi:hypothetical protein